MRDNNLRLQPWQKNQEGNLFEVLILFKKKKKATTEWSKLRKTFWKEQNSEAVNPIAGLFFILCSLNTDNFPSYSPFISGGEGAGRGKELEWVPGNQ